MLDVNVQNLNIRTKHGEPLPLNSNRLGKLPLRRRSTSLLPSSLSFPFHIRTFLLLDVGIPLSAAMLAQNAYSATAQHSPYLQANPSTTQEDFKASYDDLIDEHASPYSANAQHQTFAVGTPNHTHQRGTSIPLSSKNAYASNMSDDTHETTSSYPPILPSKEVDTRTLWQKVSTSYPIFPD